MNNMAFLKPAIMNGRKRGISNSFQVSVFAMVSYSLHALLCDTLHIYCGTLLQCSAQSCAHRNQHVLWPHFLQHCVRRQCTVVYPVDTLFCCVFTTVLDTRSTVNHVSATCPGNDTWLDHTLAKNLIKVTVCQIIPV